MGPCTVEAKPISLAKQAADNVTLVLETIRQLDLIYCILFSGETMKQEEPTILTIQDAITITTDRLKLANEIANTIINKMKGGE